MVGRSTKRMTLTSDAGALCGLCGYRCRGKCPDCITDDLRAKLALAMTHHENTCGVVGELRAMVEAYRVMKQERDDAKAKLALAEEQRDGWRHVAHYYLGDASDHMTPTEARAAAVTAEHDHFKAMLKEASERALTNAMRAEAAERVVEAARKAIDSICGSECHEMSLCALTDCIADYDVAAGKKDEYEHPPED